MAGTLQGELGDLSRLDDGRLAEIFQQRRDDQQFLDALNEELKQRDSDEALDLQIEVVKARRSFAGAAMSKQTVPRPRQSDPIRDWLCAFLDGRSLLRPDGRALHRYRMTDGEYDQAKKHFTCVTAAKNTTSGKEGIRGAG
jgi:hypothetical protein